MLKATFNIQDIESAQRALSEKSLAIFQIAVASVPSFFSKAQSKLMV
jgi:hypothetical protein